MIDKVILDIAHSDDYTDYLFMTAALTNSRVIPLIDPSAEELREAERRQRIHIQVPQFQKDS